MTKTKTNKAAIEAIDDAEFGDASSKRLQNEDISSRRLDNSNTSSRRLNDAETTSQRSQRRGSASEFGEASEFF